MKKSGFTLVEIIVVVAIVAILATIGSISLSGRGVKNAKSEVTARVPMLISNAFGKSFDNGEEVEINFDFPNKTITSRTSGGAIIDRINLPNILKYELVANDGTTSISDTTVNVSQTASITDTTDDISLLVKDKNDTFVLRVRMRNIANTAIVEIYTKDFNTGPSSRM